MKYIICYENLICKDQALLLSEEIEKFDLRSEVSILDFNHKSLRKQAKRITNLDIIIVIGSNRSKQLIKIGQKNKVKTLHYYQWLIGERINIDIELLANKGYLDLPVIEEPVHNNVKYHGNLLFELVRKNTEISANDPSAITPVVSIISSSHKSSSYYSKLAEKLSSESKNFEFQYIDLDRGIKDATQKVLNSNVALALDQLSSMFCVFANCPCLLITKASIFSRFSSKKSIANVLLKKEAIASYESNKIESIIDELERLIHDHQYTAEMLSNYQELKSVIGMSPVARPMAREIIEWLEESD